MNRLFVVWFSVAIAFSVSVAPTPGDEPTDEKFTQQQLDNFENKVRPILVRRCNECHANGESEGGLSIASRKAMLKGGDTGAAIVPGDPDESLLIQAIRYDDVYEMPPSSKMPDEEIKILEAWVRDRAPWPAHSDVEVETAGESFDIKARQEEHWCWQDINPPSFPEHLSPSAAVDFLLQDRMEEQGLSPNGPTDRSSLLRRISFDLTGLPPSQDLIQRFVFDKSMDTPAVIDEVLASPHFGERWARHWMDLMRYAETYGHEFDYPIKDAWRYRDYLIRAFNADLPYDQFIIEHIAGDLMDEPRLHPKHEFNESKLATGFWFLGEATHAPVDSKADEAGRVDNQIDVMCRSFIGMTVACARCHDHKFDAISTKDYYALAGFLQSSRRYRDVVDKGKKFESASSEILELRKQLDEEKSKVWDELKTIRALTNEDREGVWLNEKKLEIARGRFAKSIKESPIEFASEKAHLREGEIEFPLNEANWKTEGFAFHGNRMFGNQLIGETLDWLPDHVICSANNGEPFAGMAHSSTFELTKKFIHVRMKAKSARVEVVVDGMTMHEFNPLLFKGLIHKDVNIDSFQWFTIGGDLYLHQNHRAWLEIVDGGDGFFAIDRVVFSDHPKPPSDTTSGLEGSVEKQIAKDDFDGAAVLKEIIAGNPHSNGQIVAWFLRHELGGLLNAELQFDRIRELQQKIKTIADGLPKPAKSLVMTDGFPEDEFVFVRGNHKMKGEVAHRQFLTAIVGEDQSLRTAQTSGRMHLAQQIVAPKNPLTSRVIVNRVWHHLFGKGIVPSVDNFGVLGEEPSHPELLDHLADEFVKDGWSLKRLVRKLMLTDAYQRSSKPTESANEIDPDNNFLSRANVRRLQGESIRDSILCASGKLDRKMFGPSVDVHITPFMSGRGRPKSGPLDGSGRRSLYVAIRRNFLSPMMLAFDTPIPFNAIGKRSVSNVPAQALILMNDPFVLEQAEKFADRVIDEAQDVDARITLVYQHAFARRPLDIELEKASKFIESQAKRLGVEANSREVWKDLCHVLFNAKEFIYLK